MAECGKPTGRGVVTYPCVIEERGHAGPCVAKELPRTVEARERWEVAQAQARQESPEPSDESEAVDALGQFQGPAQTTSQRYTDGATPAPGTDPHPPLVEEQQHDIDVAEPIDPVAALDDEVLAEPPETQRFLVVLEVEAPVVAKSPPRWNWGRLGDVNLVSWGRVDE